jgi:hypothetical protein
VRSARPRLQKSRSEAHNLQVIGSYFPRFASKKGKEGMLWKRDNISEEKNTRKGKGK